MQRHSFNQITVSFWDAIVLLYNNDYNRFLATFQSNIALASSEIVPIRLCVPNKSRKKNVYFVHWSGEKMVALCYEKIVTILEQAHRIDQKCELFGSSKHQYRLNPPLDAAVVRLVEDKYNFTLPEDYFQFITEIANGGAGPDYGILSFEDSLRSRAYNDFQEAYKRSLKTPFVPRPMMPEEVESYSFAKDAYERNPDKFFIYEKEEDDICDTDGFFVLGTQGCQWDYGLVVSGKRKGQVFTADNEGAYAFEAYSFHEFYQRWLDWLSNIENIQKALKLWRDILKK